MSIFPNLSENAQKYLGILRRMVREGIRREEAYRIFRRLGRAWRRSTFLRDYRILQGVQEKAGRIRFVRHDRIPSEYLFQERRFYTPYNYYYVVRGEGYDVETGKRVVKYFTIGTHVRKTPGEVLEYAKRRWSGLIDMETGSRFNIRLEKFTLEEGYRRA